MIEVAKGLGLDLSGTLGYLGMKSEDDSVLALESNAEAS